MGVHVTTRNHMATKYMYTLYLGAEKSHIGESDRKEAIQIVSKRFDSFTVTNSTGCFLGDLEDVLVFKIRKNGNGAPLESPYLYPSHHRSGDTILFSQLACRFLPDFLVELIALEW
jgi:hypothetical protein